MDLFVTPHEDDCSTPETANKPGKPRPSRKLKRSKATLAMLGAAAAVAAGTFAVIEVSSAQAAETRTGTVTVKVVKEPDGIFASEADKESEREKQAKIDANSKGSPSRCGTSAAEPNPTRGDVQTATIDKFSADQWKVTMTFHCLDRDNPPPA